MNYPLDLILKLCKDEGNLLVAGIHSKKLIFNLKNNLKNTKIYCIGTDEDVMLFLASDFIKSGFRTDVVFQKSNFNSIPFEDDFFNMVVSDCVMKNIENPVKYLNEIDRVLKKEANFLIREKYKLPKLLNYFRKLFKKTEKENEDKSLSLKEIRNAVLDSQITDANIFIMPGNTVGITRKCR